MRAKNKFDNSALLTDKQRIWLVEWILFFNHSVSDFVKKAGIFVDTIDLLLSPRYKRGVGEAIFNHATAVNAATPCFRQRFNEATGSSRPPKIRGTVEAAIPIIRERSKRGVICFKL